MARIRRRTPSPLFIALLASVLAGCDRQPLSRFVPAPIERATAVVLRDTLGAPVVGVTVFANHLDGTEVFAGATDASGSAHFTLVAGRWSVSASSSSGGEPALVAGSTGTVRGAGSGVPDTVLFQLRLAPESVASGVARLAGRADHSGTIITVDELATYTTTDSSGAWRLTRLPPGIWTGLASQPGYRIGVFDIIVPRPADSVVVAGIPLLTPGGVPAPPR